MVDGVHFGQHCCVVALGIDIDGVKHPVSLVEGSTEDATLVTELLVGCASAAWKSPNPSWWCSTGLRRCTAPWSMSSTTR